MDDGRANLVEVLEGVDNLHDNRAALLLSHQLILLQVEVQIIAFTVLQHCAEPARGNTTHTCDPWKQTIPSEDWPRLRVQKMCSFYLPAFQNYMMFLNVAHSHITSVLAHLYELYVE